MGDGEGEVLYCAGTADNDTVVLSGGWGVIGHNYDKGDEIGQICEREK